MDAHSFFRRMGAVLLGAVLLFGGLVKLMDPLGSQLVMESYLRFMHLGFLNFAAGALSLVFNLLECVLGAALVAGLFPLVAGAATGVLMLFYTVLTLALLIVNPSMDCGCFGELVHLTHLQSFLKNIVLMLLWALAFFPVQRQVPQRKHRYARFLPLTLRIFASAPNWRKGVFRCLETMGSITTKCCWMEMYCCFRYMTRSA